MYVYIYIYIYIHIYIVRVSAFSHAVGQTGAPCRGAKAT